MQRLKQFIEHTSFFKKAFLSALTVTVLITAVLATALLGANLRASNQMIHKFLNNLMMQSNYSITYVNELAQRLTTALSGQKEVVAFLNAKQRDNMTIVMANNTVNEYTTPLPYVDSVYLYNKRQDLLISTKTGEQSSMAAFYDREVAQQVQNATKGAGKEPAPLAHTVTVAGRKYNICSYLVPQYSFEGELVAALVVNINTDVLTSTLRNINAFNDNLRFVVTDAAGNIVGENVFETRPGARTADTAQGAPQNGSDTEREAFAAGLARYIGKESGGSVENVSINGTKYLLVYSNNNAYGWYLFGMVPARAFYHDTFVTLVWCVGIIFLILALGSLAALKLAKRLNKPVEIIGRMLKGEASSEETVPALQTEEFQYMASVFSGMQEESRRFSQYKSEASRYLRQEFLENLITGATVYSQEKIEEQLAALGCPFLLHEQLCMCVFKLDGYAEFVKNNNQRERWALCYAVLNIASELFSEHFACESIQYGTDKFVTLIDCRVCMDFNRFSQQLEETLREILAQVKKHLRFTLTVAYSTFFKGASHLPLVYDNMAELLLLKLRYGHGTVISPYKAEDVNFTDFSVSTHEEDALVQAVLAAKQDVAQKLLDGVADTMFSYSYNEIVSYLVHLAYRVFSAVKEANPSGREDIAGLFRGFVASLTECEIEADFKALFSEYLANVCRCVAVAQQNPTQQNTSLVVQKVLDIVETRYPQKDLCLSSIAEEMGLSANYIGLLFRKSQNKSVAKYITDLRLEKIAHSLSTTARPVSKILEEAGFEPEQKNYLYTLFQKYFGVSIKQYRIREAEKRSRA